MTRAIAIGAFALVGMLQLPATTWAGDAWNDKPAANWTDKDVQKLRTKSPWAKEVSMSLNQDRSTDMMQNRGGRGGGGGGGGGMGGAGGGAGMGGSGSRPGMNGEAERAPVMQRQQERKVTVRWESAAPMRAAPAKENDPVQAKIAEWSKDYYVVTAVGLGGGMMGGGGGGMRRNGGWNNGAAAPAGGIPDSDSPAAPEARRPDPERMAQLQAQMQERMKSSTALRRKGKDPIAPARVERLQTPDGPAMVFLFPREPITADDKEVSFETAAGPMELKVKFPLKDMIYQGKLEL